jgi:hypothetical protein
MPKLKLTGLKPWEHGPLSDKLCEPHYRDLRNELLARLKERRT